MQRKFKLLNVMKLGVIFSTVLSINYWMNAAIPTVMMKTRIDRQLIHHDPKLQILLPLYIYPNWYDKQKYVWKQVAIAAKKVPIVAIINPNSGPNNAPPNLDYQQGIKDLLQAGVKIIGYVPSNYAKRDIKAVKADIDLYAKYFQVDGIFIDEAASSPDKLKYYQQVYQHIKSRSSDYRVIINPGVNIEDIYVNKQVADTIVTFENDRSNWDNYRLPTYTKKYPPQNFAALVHTTANRKYNFGYVYITDDSIHTANRNPWDTLPEYWQAEVNYIQKLNLEN
jgi:Spherulation-specific family 4